MHYTHTHEQMDVAREGQDFLGNGENDPFAEAERTDAILPRFGQRSDDEEYRNFQVHLIYSFCTCHNHY